MERTRPIIALLYDYDKTLCTQDMQNYGFIPSLGMAPEDFWRLANAFGWREKMDGILAYMYTMIVQCREKGVPFTRDTLRRHGRNIAFFPGVTDWFDRITRFGESLQVDVEHYVISSGLREIIEGSAIAGCFKEIYASEFYYDEAGRPAWPKLAVNFTAKTQFVYRINKGVLDVPCMKMMRSYGGQAIAVYQPVNRPGVEQLLRDGRVDYIFPADYREGTALEETIQDIIRRMAVSHRLEETSAGQLRAVGRKEETRV